MNDLTRPTLRALPMERCYSLPQVQPHNRFMTTRITRTASSQSMVPRKYVFSVNHLNNCTEHVLGEVIVKGAPAALHQSHRLPRMPCHHHQPLAPAHESYRTRACRSQHPSALVHHPTVAKERRNRWNSASRCRSMHSPRNPNKTVI